MSLFKDTYRVETTRLPDYDYSQEGAYYITICTKNHEQLFGRVSGDKVELSQIGRFALNCWKTIPDHFPNVYIDFVIIMPNHIHGILFINNVSPTQETLCATSLHSGISPKSGTISTIIRSFKSAVTFLCNKNNLVFAWQPRFYEHIIRNETELFRVREYIMNNPLKWSLDKFNIDI